MMDKDQMIRALKDIGAFILICALGWVLINMFSGCKSVPAQVVDNSTVTTETTRTEYAPDGTVSAVEVHKEVVKSDVVTEVTKPEKKSGFPWVRIVLIIVLVISACVIPFEYIRRKNL